MARPLAQPAARPAARRRRLRERITLKRVVLSLLALVVLWAGWYGWKVGYNLHKLFGGNPFSIFTTSKLKGEDSGRVNILLAGNSVDDPGHQGAALTDSIMILSIDTQNHTAFMMSVPRDLYVKYGTYNCIEGDQGKINAAYLCGQQQHFSQAGYPNGGMGQLEKVVSQDFGIPIDYYALVDYSAIRDAVNAVGGIDINVQSSDPRGIYDPDIDYATHPHTVLVKLSDGWHHLDGEQALDLARARGDAYGSYGYAGSDFTRTMYQREMLIALEKKAVSAGVLANPVRMSQLFDTVGSHVKTDLTLPDVHRLYDLTKGINFNSIQSIGLNDVNGKNLLANYYSPTAGDSLIPAAGMYDYSAIQQLLARLTSNNPVVKEQATVVVLNGTDAYGLAGKQQKVLESHYLNVTQVGDASNTPTTQIIDNSGGSKPATLQLLKSLYGTNVTTTNPYSGYSADFIVVLGADQLTQQ